MSPRDHMPVDFTPIQLCPVHREPAGVDGRCQLCFEEEGRAGGGWRALLAVVILLFLGACGAGGFLLFNRLSPATPSVTPASPGDAKNSASDEENPAWARAIGDLANGGQAAPAGQEVERTTSDGGVTTYSLPSGKLVVRRGPPRRLKVRGPEVEKKYGGEIRRKPRRRPVIKLHGEPGADGETTMATAPAPPAQPRARTQARPRVLMYSTAWCGACKAARAWFARTGVPYLEKNIEQDPVARRNMMGVNPRGGVPTFVIKGQVMVGFSAEAIQQALQ